MNALESRLTEALHARAEQVQPADLGPAHVPATVSPLRRRLRVGGAIAAAAGVAAAAVVAVSVMAGDDETGPVPATPPTISDTSNPTTPATPDPTTSTDPSGGALGDLVPFDTTSYVEPGTTVRFADGETAAITGGELVVTGSGSTLRGPLEDVDPQGPASITRVSLGQVGNGYLVAQSPGGDSLIQELYVAGDGGGLVLARATGDVPFGFGYAEGFPDGFMTWTTGDGSGLFTRVQLGDPAGNRWQVYRWEVTGPGEGGGPEALARDLVATDLGVACFGSGNPPESVTPC